LQIVSTDLPEMQHFPDYCLVAKNYEEFESAVKTALQNDSPLIRRERSQVMWNQTWDRKVVELGETVLRVKAQQARPGAG
jgi:ribosomal protein L16 Arg81 hydroxylase